MLGSLFPSLFLIILFVWELSSWPSWLVGRDCPVISPSLPTLPKWCVWERAWEPEQGQELGPGHLSVFLLPHSSLSRGPETLSSHTSAGREEKVELQQQIKTQGTWNMGSAGSKVSLTNGAAWPFPEKAKCPIRPRLWHWQQKAEPSPCLHPHGENRPLHPLANLLTATTGTVALESCELLSCSPWKTCP